MSSKAFLSHSPCLSLSPSNGISLIKSHTYNTYFKVYFQRQYKERSFQKNLSLSYILSTLLLGFIRDFRLVSKNNYKFI